MSERTRGARRCVLRLRAQCPPAEIRSIADRFYRSPAEINLTAAGFHCPLAEIHAAADRFCRPRAEIHAKRDRIKAISGRMNVIRGRMNAIWRRDDRWQRQVNYPGVHDRTASKRPRGGAAAFPRA